MQNNNQVMPIEYEEFFKREDDMIKMYFESTLSE